MTYKDYKKMFEFFNTSSCYYEACKILCFDPIWDGKEEYTDKIRGSIKETIQRLGKNKIIGADVCCGDYSWIPRHFADYFEKMYCVDIDKQALKSTAINRENNCESLNQNANEIEILVDFLFCGNNVYSYFINNISRCVNPNGAIFLMKPAEGDDFSIRTLTKAYNLNQREIEIRDISALLKKYFCINDYNMSFSWHYPEANLEKILAALSVVSLGGRDRLDEENYSKALSFLEERVYDDTLTITQKCKIWEGVKNV